MSPGNGEVAAYSFAGALGGLTLRFRSTPTDRNIDFLPDLPAPPQAGTISYTGTGTARMPDPALPLVYAVLGPGATPLGLGDVFLSTIFPVPLVTTIRPEEAALGLLEFNGWSDQGVLQSNWNVGALVRLPIQRQGTGPYTWICEAVQVPLAQGELDFRNLTTARELVGADPLQEPARQGMDALRSKVANVLRDCTGPSPAMSLADYGKSLAKRSQRNPYESLFTTLEAFAQSNPSVGPDRRGELMSGFLAQLTQPQLEVIAATSGGNAILRQVFTVLAGAERDRVGEAIKQVKDSTGAFLSLTDRLPSLVPKEPPLCPELKVTVDTSNQKRGTIQQFVMTFGRRITIGADTSTPYGNANWKGPSIVGETRPEEYLDKNGAALPVPLMGATPARAKERWDSRMRVVLPLVLNEGNIEGLRMADKAFLSFGFQQWSFHVNEEGTVLLERFRANNPLLFDVFFGMAGLNTAICDHTGDPAVALNVLAADNQDAYTPVGTSWVLKDKGAIEEYYPRYATLTGAAPGGAPKVLPLSDMAAEGADRSRFAFFGFTVDKEPVYVNHKVTRKGEFKIAADHQQWAGRFRLALQTVPEWIPLQFQQAAYRFTQLQRRITVTFGDRLAPSGSFKEIPNWCGHPHPLTEVLSSEFAAALVLDIFINGTGLAGSVVREAWRRTEAALAADGIAPASLHEAATGSGNPPLKREVLYRFWLALAGVRRAYGFDPDIRTTRALGMLDRQPDEVYQPNSGDFLSGKSRQVKFDLKSAPGSFKGWD